MKRLFLIFCLLISSNCFGDIFINNFTQDADSAGDKLVVYYKICNDYIPFQTTPLCGSMQISPPLRNGSNPIAVSSTTNKIVVYQVDVINSGFKIYSKQFDQSRDGVSMCTNNGDKIILKAYNNSKNVNCNGAW